MRIVTRTSKGGERSWWRCAASSAWGVVCGVCAVAWVVQAATGTGPGVLEAERAARLAALRDSAMAQAYYLRSAYLRNIVAHLAETGRGLRVARELLLEAEVYLERALEYAPSSVYLWWEYAGLNQALGRVGKVIGAYERLSELAPSAGVWTRLGNLYELRGEADRAVRAYRQALALERDNEALREHIVDVYVEAGLRARQRGDDELAREQLRRAREELRGLPHMEKKVRLRMKEGLLCELVEDYGGALTAYWAAAALDSEDGEAIMRAARMEFELGEAAERRGDEVRAEEHYRRAAEAALKVVPGKQGSPEALNFAAYALAVAGVQLDVAEQLVRKAIERDASNGAYIDTLGWILYRRGQHEEALRAILRAHELEGDDPVIMDHLGDIYYTLNQPEKARELWERSLQLDAENVRIERKLRKIR
ncbi:MAG: tetratricopeptide repeat protein [bacterium]|nr:tetratricopeptide repeat protein [bacterium]